MDRINRSIDRAMDDIELPEVNIGWKQQVILIGGVVGAVLGLASAYMYIRAAEEASTEGESPATPSGGDAVKLGLSLLTIMRTITEWGTRK